MQTKSITVKVLIEPGVDLLRRVTGANTNGQLRPTLEPSK